MTAGSATNWASETAGTATSLGSYNSSFVCKDGLATVASGSGTSTPHTLTVAAGHNVICTFTNQRKVSVELKKNTAPQDSSLWNFSVTDGNATTYQTYSDQSTPFDSGAVTVAPTNAELDEWAGTGGDISDYQVSAACTDNGVAFTPAAQGFYGSPSHYYVYFPVVDGYSYVCTFTNTAKATVQVTKNTVPAADGSLWNFVITNGSATTYNTYADQAVPFDSGVQTILSPTNIEIDEWAGTGSDIANYAAQVNCADDGNPLVPAASGYYDAGGGQIHFYAYFPAQKGHDYTCSFTNQQERAFTGTGGNDDLGDIISFDAGGLERYSNFDVNSVTQDGLFVYLDANSDYYDVDVSCVKISGSTAYFAGPVANATQPAWNSFFLLAKVVDGVPDMISASFVAVDPCSTLGTVDPTDGPFTLDSGSITVVGGF